MLFMISNYFQIKIFGVNEKCSSYFAFYFRGEHVEIRAYVYTG
jgi:hypothetical protein